MVPKTSKDTAVEAPGRYKRKRAPQQDVGALNECLCGDALQPSSNGVLKCKRELKLMSSWSPRVSRVYEYINY